MDLDGNQKISLEEFMAWYKAGNGEIHPDEKKGVKEIRDAKIEGLKRVGKIPLSEEVEFLS